MTPPATGGGAHPAPRAAAYAADPRTMRVLAATAAIGAAGFVAGAFVAPERAWTGLLAGFHVVTGIALAGAVFLALLHCSGARWASALLRVPEAMSRALPVGAVAAVVLLFGAHAIFPWTHESHVRGDAVLEAKAPYLNVPFLAVRTTVAFAAWWFLARRLREARPGASRVRWGAAFMAVFGVTYSLVAVDWIKSLEPHFTSTLFGLIAASGAVLSGLAAAIVLSIHLRRSGAWRGVLRDEHLHDMAKLLFGFSLFWSYLQYCQHMLIWYTNMPEETAWYAPRLQGMWWTTGALAFALCGVVPFVALLFRGVRRSESGMLRVACIVLVGRVAEMFFLVGPPLLGPSPWPAVWEVLPLVGMLAFLAWAVLGALARGGPAVRESEPGLEHSLHYHA